MYIYMYSILWCILWFVKPFHSSLLYFYNDLISLFAVFDIEQKSFGVHGNICSFHAISINTQSRARERGKLIEWELNKHGITAAEQSEIVLQNRPPLWNQQTFCFPRFAWCSKCVCCWQNNSVLSVPHTGNTTNMPALVIKEAVSMHISCCI